MIGRGDRDLVATTSSVVMEETTVLLSSAIHFVENKRKIFGIESLSKSFQSTVWIFLCLALVLLILTHSCMDYLKAIKAIQDGKNSSSSIPPSLFDHFIQNSFKYFGNLMKQCKFRNNFIIFYGILSVLLV